jgi:hypothetical protein
MAFQGRLDAYFHDGNADVFSRTFKRIRLHNGDGEGKRTVCSGYDTTGSVALRQVISYVLLVPRK